MTSNHKTRPTSMFASAPAARKAELTVLQRHILLRQESTIQDLTPNLLMWANNSDNADRLFR